MRYFQQFFSEKKYINVIFSKETLEYGKFSFGICKNNDDKNEPDKSECGRKRKERNRFVVPGKYDCYTKIKKTTMVLDKELQKRKEKFKTVEIHHQRENMYRIYPVFATKKQYKVCRVFNVLSI